MLKDRFHRGFLLLVVLALAASAHASYGQMRLDGLSLLLALALLVVYGVLVDIAVLVGVFRYRTAVVVAMLIAAAVIFFLVVVTASPGERLGFFKGAPGGAALVLSVATSAVFLPFIVIAPIAQHLSMRHGRRWPRWIAVWMVVQMVLPIGFLVLAGTEEYFWQQDHAAGQAAGREVRAGGLTAILERAEQRHERIWGTGWHLPWKQDPPPGSYPRASAWQSGLARSVDASALIAANEPLSAPDRAALQALLSRHFVVDGTPHAQTKLIWDALEPGGFARQLAPAGVNESSVVSETLIPPLLDRLEKHGDTRLCPGGRMLDADRAILNALVLAKERIWNAEKRDYELRPQWVDFPRRLERICREPDLPAIDGSP